MKQKQTTIGRAALLTVCAGLSACSLLGFGPAEKSLNEQAAWASALAKERNRPHATALAPGPNGTVRLVGNELQPVPPPPQIAQLSPAVPAPAPTLTPELSAPTPPVAQSQVLPAASVATASAIQAAPDERRAVLNQILAWRKAWIDGDVETYIAQYDSAFRGDLRSRKAWEKQRRERLANRGIAVRIDNLTAMLDDGNAKAEFTQTYTSKKHEDVGTKTMMLRKINGKWLIVEEKWRKG